ncbi:MAG: hypothetical protein ACFCGT_25560 [Sandaracinaceae bacterium]
MLRSSWFAVALTVLPVAPAAAQDGSEPSGPEGGPLPAAFSEEGAGEAGEGAQEEEPSPFGYAIDVRYRIRMNFLGDFPLDPIPGEDRAETSDLGQNYFGTQWLRLGGELRYRSALRIVGELDLMFGVAFGELAVGTQPAAFPRDEYGYPGIRLRQLYLAWDTGIGELQVGQLAFDWGLGVVSNGGDRDTVFGDPQFGDLVRRVAFVTKPGGEGSAFSLALAGDWVAWDLVADFASRSDVAFQGLLMAWIESGDDELGVYLGYRRQENPQDAFLEVFIADAYARLHVADPTGEGRIRLAGEISGSFGQTSYFRTPERPRQDVRTLLGVVQLGRVSDQLDVIVEGGYASGDADPTDGVVRRATIDPDHRVGLVMFSEVIAWQTARSANLLSSPELFGRPVRGAELLPTNGGVAGAYYLFPHVVWRPTPLFEARLGGLLGWASAPGVDPFRVVALNRRANYRGGDPQRRDLGAEVDAALLLHGPLAPGIALRAGVEGGLYFPAGALADAMGLRPGAVGMLRIRLGLTY